MVDSWTTQAWTARVYLYWNFKNKYVPQYSTVCSWVNPWMWNLGCGRPTVKFICGFSSAWGLAPCPLHCSRVNCTSHYLHTPVYLALSPLYLGTVFYDWNKEWQCCIIKHKREMQFYPSFVRQSLWRSLNLIYINLFLHMHLQIQVIRSPQRIKLLVSLVMVIQLI